MYLHKLRHAIHKTILSAADLLYPSVCSACGNPADRPGCHICWQCFSTLSLEAGYCCSLCGHPIQTTEDHSFICGACRHIPPAFDRARVAGRFEGKLRHLTHMFKYRHALWLAADLAELLHGSLLSQFNYPAIDLILPIPLHTTRARSRGYNQAELLATHLGHHLNRPVVPQALIRTRNTGTQTRLTLTARHKNVTGAFAVSDSGWVKGRTILLVDDVMTTGATFSSAARTLKKSGAWRVWAVALARGQ
ncbi:MAG: ComF family protein [Lentisphaerae bacterium]|jgi:ComF family protein|nr:ComF family protein [Lentisphaerota bacterium]